MRILALKRSIHKSEIRTLFRSVVEDNWKVSGVLSCQSAIEDTAIRMPCAKVARVGAFEPPPALSAPPSGTSGLASLFADSISGLGHAGTEWSLLLPRLPSGSPQLAGSSSGVLKVTKGQTKSRNARSRFGAVTMAQGSSMSAKEAQNTVELVRRATFGSADADVLAPFAQCGVVNTQQLGLSCSRCVIVMAVAVEPVWIPWILHAAMQAHACKGHQCDFTRMRHRCKTLGQALWPGQSRKRASTLWTQSKPGCR